MQKNNSKHEILTVDSMQLHDQLGKINKKKNQRKTIISKILFIGLGIGIIIYLYNSFMKMNQMSLDLINVSSQLESTIKTLDLMKNTIESISRQNKILIESLEKNEELPSFVETNFHMRNLDDLLKDNL